MSRLLSTRTTIFGNKNHPQVEFVQKSKHILTSLSFLGIGTIFASHSRESITSRNFASNCMTTSSLIFILHSGFILLSFYITGLHSAHNGKQWTTMSIYDLTYPHKTKKISLNSFRWVILSSSNLDSVQCRQTQSQVWLRPPFMSVSEIEEFFSCGFDFAFVLHTICTEVDSDLKAHIPTCFDCWGTVGHHSEQEIKFQHF